jgi:hypothetical protein
MTTDEIRRTFRTVTPAQFVCGFVAGVTLAMIVILTVTLTLVLF